MNDERIEERRQFYLNSNLNISNERKEYSLTLRKKKLFNEFLKRRYNDLNDGNIDSSIYEINKNILKINKEYSSLEFQSIKDYILFCENHLSEKETLDNILAFIFLLKRIKYKQKDICFISKKFSEKLSDILIKYIDNITLISETLQFLDIVSYLNNNENIINYFTSISYIIIYKKIIGKYNNDHIIMSYLINLLGNLVCGNISVQKLFYESNIYDSIKEIYLNTLIEDKRHFYFVWFFSVFMNKINKNEFFKNNFEIFYTTINIFYDNIFYEKMTKDCLLGISFICEIEDIRIIQYILEKQNLFDFLLSLPIDYYEIIYYFLYNISKVSFDICSILISNYNICEFLIKGLNTQFKCEFLNLLNVYLNSCKKQIKKILFDTGIINNLLSLIQSNDNNIIYSTLICFNSLLTTCDDDIIYFLYTKKFISLLINVFFINLEINILLIDLIIIFLRRDDENKIYKKELENYNIKEILNKISFECKINVIEETIKNILVNYF